jgi:hypothetical protein
MDDPITSALHIGWSSADITPDEPVQLAGQHYARISEGVRDPVTATALALAGGDAPDAAVILVSCDLVSISDSLKCAVRERVAASLPELAPEAIILNATHTHTAPLARTEADEQKRAGASVLTREIPLPAMPAEGYIAWAAERIAAAVVAAWRGRVPGAIGYALGQAVVGRNRRSVYARGESRMYGDTTAADFSHIEGCEDHSVNLLATWNAAGELTGVVVNVPCPSQETENLFEISADYWHDTRVELRRRLGQNLFVLPQCSAAGDQSPHIQWDKAAEARMRRLAGRDERQEIAARIAAAVEGALPLAALERQSNPFLQHRCETVDLPRRRLTDADVREALAGGEPHRQAYARLLAELEAHPELREKPRWYVPITYEYRRWRWHASVELRHDLEAVQPTMPVELHAVRLGDLAFATNPFEYYLDYGIRIKARSPAMQTFLVQLAGAGSYVPSARSLAGKGYGSVPASTPVGPEGGDRIAEWTVASLKDLWT